MVTKTKFSPHEVWRQNVSSFSDSVKTRDQLELSHPYGSSGLRYLIHAPKLAAGGALEALWGQPSSTGLSITSR